MIHNSNYFIYQNRLPIPNYYLFFFNDAATTEIYTLSLHDALPISEERRYYSEELHQEFLDAGFYRMYVRSEEHTSELQSPYDLVCRLLLEKKKKKKNKNNKPTTQKKNKHNKKKKPNKKKKQNTHKK